jgi:hypothetical protein
MSIICTFPHSFLRIDDSKGRDQLRAGSARSVGWVCTMPYKLSRGCLRGFTRAPLANIEISYGDL